MSLNPIAEFLEQVRARLNRGALLRVMAWILLAAAISCVLWAMGWRIFGYAAPKIGYALIATLGLVSAGIWYVSSLRKTKEAARVADDRFALKDGLMSWLDFRGDQEGREAFQLHECWLSGKVADLNAKSVELPNLKKTWIAGVLTLVVASILALLPHSESVRRKLALEALTSERTAVVSAEMEETIEELIKQLSEEERELIDEKKLREWSKAIAQTKDPREAEKQLAKIEQQVAQTLQGLEARQDEAMLKLAAEELEKSAVADVRQIGNKLDTKDFEKAQQQLKDMKPAGEKKMTPEQLQKLRENAAKSKELAKRMADGAKKRDFGKMNKGDGKMGAMKPSDGRQKPMQQMLDELDAAARQLDKKLAEETEMDEDADAMVGEVKGKMDELGDRLGKLGARAKMKGKLNALRAGLAQARSFSQGRAQAAGLAQSQSQSENPGGKQAGVGSSESRRNERDELKDNGNRVEVKGQDNADGPSTNAIETAESGTGVAGRASVAKEREFKQQYESLVHRDDIPESLKLGIREYFEKVHETAPEEK